MEFVWLAVEEEGTGRASLIDGEGSPTPFWSGSLTELWPLLGGRPLVVTGTDAGPWENACTLPDLAALVVPGAADPYRVHGLAPGDDAGLAAALYARLDRLDTGLVELAALLVRGANPALGRFLAAVAEAMAGDGRPARPATDWIEPHDRNEKPPANRTPVPLDVAAVSALLGPDGPMARVMPGYEPRPSQIDVAQRMTEALNRNRHLLMEAPTGTGKSLAYL
ncbi:MAG TPA: hypothetical protein VK464_16710, partial [Symbiobacteriaceae bacterium]|nr:hypothetical protein [Symbiobacteriaceae bacterium]